MQTAEREKERIVLDNSAILREISECYQSYNHKTAEDVRPLYESLDDPHIEVNGDPILVYAAKRADHVGIKVLLDKGADGTFQDEYGSNALHKMAYENAHNYAPWADEKETARLLIEAGASAIRKNSDSYTCTHIAAEHGKLGVIEALAQAGKKMDLPDKKGETALHHACDRITRAANSYYKYAKSQYDKVMSETADGNEYRQKDLARRQAHCKETCDREWAEIERYFGILKCLLEAGLDPDQKDNYGKTPKQIAFDCMDIRVPALLDGSYAEGDEQNEEKKLQMLAKGMNLMQATEKKDYDAVEALLKLGTDPNEFYGEELYHYSTSLQGKAPLAMACIHLDPKLVCLLLEHGALPNQKDSDGKIPMMYSFYAGVNSSVFEKKVVEAIMKAMIDHGLEVNQEADEGGNTLLNVACKQVDSASGYNNNTLPGKLISQLLRYKADPNLADNSGVTPLMSVCKGRSGYMEDIQISLLEAGAKVFAQDRNGNTPLMYAAENSKHALAKTMAEMLFEFGDPKPDTVNNDGKTALAFASEQNNENLVSFLLMKA